MNKVIILFFLLTFCFQNVMSQKIININWTILINEKLESSEIMSSRIIVKTANDSNQVFNTWCYAGNLEIRELDFDRIFSEKVTSVWFEISTKENRGQSFNYKIKLKKKWFKTRYMVLKIYNLRKKKYRKMFVPSKNNKEFVYEIDFPGFSIRQLRRKG